MIQSINSIEDVRQFTKIVIEEGTNLHPDEDFLNYVNINTGEPAYSVKDAEIRNTLLEKSFLVCKTNCLDIYELMHNIFLKETGLDKFIPVSED